MHFKDVNTEETFSSQEQKLVETTNLWRQFSSDKKSPQRKSASSTIAKSVDLMIGTTMNSSDFLTSHTLSWKMKKKNVPQKIASRTNTKKDIFQKHKDQNQKLSTPKNVQQTHNAVTFQKLSLCFSKMSKLKKHSVTKTRS